MELLNEEFRRQSWWLSIVWYSHHVDIMEVTDFKGIDNSKNIEK